MNFKNNVRHTALTPPDDLTGGATVSPLHGLRAVLRERFPSAWERLREGKFLAMLLREKLEREGVGLLPRFAGRKWRAAKSLREDRRKLHAPPGILWVDLGEWGELFDPRDGGKWQDHGMGLLRTVLHQNGILTQMVSTRGLRGPDQLRPLLGGHHTLVMNVRSYTYAVALEVAKLFKEVRPDGRVIVGGMHATVAPGEMEAVPDFDHICKGPGEGLIVDLMRDPASFPRVFEGRGAKSMAEWPDIDRTLWPKPRGFINNLLSDWPLEPDIGWGPSPVATILTSRVCPWRCSFCNENSFIANMGRRPVDAVIDELNRLDEKYGVGSVVIHDSMFFQNPKWLEEWLEKYPKRARKRWTYWAAARADTVRQWPDLFEALVRETNWRTISIGFESGSDRVLRILNKECTEEDNYFAIDLVNRLGDELEAAGEEPPVFWSNIMFAIPGELPEDAIKTMRMLRRMKRVTPSVAFYAPFPGSALGHQIIAEGKSLLDHESHDRGAHFEKVRGVDYGFYRDLLTGRYDDVVNAELTPEQARRDHRLLHGGHISEVVRSA